MIATGPGTDSRFETLRSQWRTTLIAFAVLVSLMAVGSLMGSRRLWLLISLFNNLFLLLFFKYARFVIENLSLIPGDAHEIIGRQSGVGMAS